MDESGRLGFPGSTANPSRRSLTGSRLTRECEEYYGMALDWNYL